ncbi:MAG: hypothetical protein INR70_28910 [Parafilimonas terrae]|nr:hypothetical protein [Parafilimonas terrae]
MAGAVLPQVGRLIERPGGRPVPTGAIVRLVLALPALAVAPNRAVYGLAWVLLGLGMGAGPLRCRLRDMRAVF